MRSITFNYKNLQKVEKFIDGKLDHFFNGLYPSAEYTLNREQDEFGVKNKKIKLDENDVIFKDSKGNIFKKIN